MDLTVIATPFYFASMAAERLWLKAHADDVRFDAGQYERRDTVANLAMGTASLFVPLAAHRFRRHAEFGRGRAAGPMLSVAAAALGTSVAADAISRRHRRRRPTVKIEQNDLAEIDRPGPALSPATRSEQVAGAAAVVALASGGLVATSTWAGKLSAQRLWDRRLFDLGSGTVAITAAMVGWDFIYYWNHRLMHESRIMWAIHVPHHSSERYNLSVALRQPVADALGIFVPYGVMSLFGVRPALIETARGVNLIYQYWVHTEAIPKLGRFERQMNTPSHHRVHHGSNSRYIDRNHGGILISWDKAFGTFEPEDEPVVYGLTKNLDSFSLLTITFREYCDIIRDVFNARSWRDRLGFVFRGPGWAYERQRKADTSALAG